MSTFPAATRHGELEELFDDVFFVMGSVRMPGPLPMLFSRNMVVLRDGESLTLVHSLRLDDAGLRKLDKLGKVEHVVRLAGFHGKDDPFYKDRYGAKVWAVEGNTYARGFDNPKVEAADGYFQPDVYMNEDTELPVAGAQLVTLPCVTGEGVLLLPRDGGILITGDALQNWASADPYFNFPAKVIMKLMGFLKPHNVGPGWLKQAKPELPPIRELLDLEFEHVLPVHGTPVIGDARAKFRPAVEQACAS